MIHNINKILIIFAVLIFASCGRDGPLLVDASIDELSRSLNDIAPKLMEKNNVVGLSVVIIRANEVVVSRSFGYADLESKRKIDEQTVYKVASLGKPVFSYIVVTLAQQGKIDLDKQLYSYFGEGIIDNDFRSRKITARMVLSHTTGLPNLGKQTTLKFYFEPGKEFMYSGHAYEYLQKVIEKITNKRLNELATEIVFKPLAMADSSYIWRESYKSIISSSYGVNKDKYEVKREAKLGHAAWSLYTTSADYSKFVIHVMSLSKEQGSIASRILLPIVDVAKDVKWGLGWGIQDTTPRQSFWHWGSMAGFRHYVIAYPDEKVAVIVMANSEKSFKMVDDIMVKSIGGSFPSYDWF